MDNKSTIIITDSGSDLDRDVAREMGIEVLPLGVEINGQQYLDRVDLSPSELFHKMIHEKAHPKTSQVSLGTLQQTFQMLLSQGSQCIYISLSSKISGTYSSAILAQNEVGEGVYALDSRGASVGQALLAIEAAKLRDARSSVQDIINRVEWMSKRMEHIFCVESLEYLHRGGRISHTKALVGTLLGIKPILHFIDGAIFPLENTRSRKKAMSRILDLMEERGVDLPSQTIGLSYANNPETALEMKLHIQERFGCKDFFTSEIAGAIGSHAGPGTFSVFFLSGWQGGGTRR